MKIMTKTKTIVSKSRKLTNVKMKNLKTTLWEEFKHKHK